MLKQHINPASIIDIGVAEGTPDLYRHFPTHPYLLVEANPYYADALSYLQKELNAKIEFVFCGATPGEVQLNQYSDPRKSSRFLTTRPLTLENKITIPVATLDSLIAKHQLPAPYLLKLDVEGAELEVIRGGGTTLAQCEAVIAEAAILPKYHQGPEIADLIGMMADHGFALFDLAAGANHAQTGLLYQIDCIFVQKGAPFRYSYFR